MEYSSFAVGRAHAARQPQFIAHLLNRVFPGGIISYRREVRTMGGQGERGTARQSAVGASREERVAQHSTALLGRALPGRAHPAGHTLPGTLRRGHSAAGIILPGITLPGTDRTGTVTHTRAEGQGGRKEREEESE